MGTALGEITAEEHGNDERGRRVSRRSLRPTPHPTHIVIPSLLHNSTRDLPMPASVRLVAATHPEQNRTNLNKAEQT